MVKVIHDRQIVSVLSDHLKQQQLSQVGLLLALGQEVTLD